jgi:citrate lyase subunit beta / citryl-CoA lyase
MDDDIPRLVPSNIETARSLLFVPGDRPDRFEKAAASGADAVICDLEDAVPAEHKAAARANVAEWLGRTGTACVRLNAMDSPYFDAECAALAKLPGLRGVLVPKATGPAGYAALSAALGSGVRIVALIESALGLHRAYAIAASPGVARLAFGSIDFALDVGATEDDLSLLYARSALVVASRAANLVAPIDGVTTALDDVELVGAEAAKARRLGFGGKLCVHPRQVSAVNQAFTPTDEELRWARQVVESTTDDGANRVDGLMVDKPVADRARQILSQAGPPTASADHELNTR